jgi:cobalt-zinc-cadmium efflux system protein
MPLGHSHLHAHTAPAQHPHSHYPEKMVVYALIGNIILCAIEVLVGLWADSLALIADALHNTTDIASLGIALWARHIAHRPPDLKRTYGYVRAESVSAFVNLLILIALGLYLGGESIHHMFNPTSPNGSTIMIMAGIALLVNGVTALILHKESHDSANMQAAFVHYLSDALASFSVILSGAAVYWLGWDWLDAILSFAIAAWITYQGITALPPVINLLMQGAPSHLTLDEIDAEMCAIEGVHDVHHIHLWQLDDNMSAMEAHVVLDDIKDMDGIRISLRKLLQDKFKIYHATFEFETLQTVCEHNIAHHPHDAEILSD